MATTIQVSAQLVGALKSRKIYEKESYEELLWGLLEDTMELNAQTKREIALARKQFKEGKFYSFDSVKRDAGL